MSSTVLPNDRVSFLPSNPTDGQIFIDSEFVQWIYEANAKVWERRGVVESIPLASEDITGLLAPSDKSLIDRVPAVPGGFGIIVDTKLLLKSPDNPEGVIQGDIKLKSESLDIVCVSAVGTKITSCGGVAQECSAGGVGTATPGLQFSLSDKFLDTLITDLPGPKGKTGEKGDKGDTGPDGFSLGPQGLKGEAGANIGELCTLTGVTYRDIEGFTDTPIVGLNLVDNDGHGCKLIVTKARINIDPNRPADKVAPTPLSRSVIYPEDPDTAICDLTRLNDWSLAQPSTDTTPLNLQLLRLAKGSNDREDEPVGFNGTMTLDAFVGDVVAEYQSRLTKLDKQWGKEAKSHIEDIDTKARTILSNLANDLSQCEFSLPAVEYCITFTGCDQPTPPASPSPAASSLASRINEQSLSGNRRLGQVSMGTRKWNVKL